MPAPEVVRMATMGGAHALGLADRIGSLELGKRGDVIAIAVDTLHTTPATSPYSAIAYAAKAADVRHVVVDGRIVVRDQRLISLDETAVKRAARQHAQRLFT